MKINIRRGTFETNSSSMHSLVVLKDDKAPKLEEENFYLNDEGVYRIWSEEDLEFGRYPFKVLSTPSDKFKYLMAVFGEKQRDKIIKSFKEIYPEITDISFPKSYDTEEPFYGYIDHQSDMLLINYLKENKISFKEFMQNTKYKIIIDGDEYCEWENIKESGLIDLDAIELDINPYSKYKEEREKHAEVAEENLER